MSSRKDLILSDSFPIVFSLVLAIFTPDKILEVPALSNLFVLLLICGRHRKFCDISTQFSHNLHIRWFLYYLKATAICNFVREVLEASPCTFPFILHSKVQTSLSLLVKSEIIKIHFKKFMFFNILFFIQPLNTPE